MKRIYCMYFFASVCVEMYHQWYTNTKPPGLVQGVREGNKSDEDDDDEASVAVYLLVVLIGSACLMNCVSTVDLAGLAWVCHSLNMQLQPSCFLARRSWRSR